MILSSDIRACFSLERAVAERRYSKHDYHTLSQTNNKPLSPISKDLNHKIWD